MALSSALLFGQAQAADMARPVYKAAPVAMAGNFYVWVDGTYNRVRLPNSSLGFHVTGTGLASFDRGPVQIFDNKLDGAGLRGAFGYVMPGSTLRFELGGSYVAADGSSQQAVDSTGVGFVAPMFLTGATNGFAIACIGGVTCVTAASRATDYDAWEINGKAAWDVTLGPATLSPSLAVFGGNARNREGLSQALTQTLGGAVLNAMNYQAETRLRWTDYGARAGLDVRFPVFANWTVDVGGWIGVAQRDVKLDGSDALTSSFAFVGPSSTSISVSDDKTVFLANAEAGLSYKINPNFTIRGFAGLNYDSKVPGISAPTFSGIVIAPTGGTAASIAYSSETSYYAGGGVSLKF